jgi:hypothetical protein
MRSALPGRSDAPRDGEERSPERYASATGRRYDVPVRRYHYVGPEEIAKRFASAPPGTAIRAAADLAPLARGEAMTFVVDADGVLRVANRRSEHVACAGGGAVLSAGELVALQDRAGIRITEISNQSTGYCPEPESWPAVAKALDDAGIAHPAGFTYEAIFRRCPSCGQRNLVKDGWFVCEVCNGDLPPTWNFADGPEGR